MPETPFRSIPVTNYSYIEVDSPAEKVNRITLNRPEKRNALSNALRCELFAELERADQDPNAHVTIIRGAGKAFSAGYDLTSLSSGKAQTEPFYTAGGLAHWPRHVVDGCFWIWDLAKPVIAQIHGYCIAGGSELAQSCDLVYVANDAQIGYPVVRNISPPDNTFYPWIVGMRKAMHLMLTGDSMTGEEAVKHGFANEAFALEDLEEGVLRYASRVASVPPELTQFNKRTVHRQMDLMGIRAAIRASTDTQQLAAMSKPAREFFRQMTDRGLTKALDERDRKFGDYRTEDVRGDGLA